MFDNDDGDTMSCASCGKNAVGAGAGGGFCETCKKRIQPEVQRTHWADEATLQYIRDAEAAVLKMRCCGNCKYYDIGHCHRKREADGRPGFDACRTHYDPATGEVTQWVNWEFSGPRVSLF